MFLWLSCFDRCVVSYGSARDNGELGRYDCNHLMAERITCLWILLDSTYSNALLKGEATNANVALPLSDRNWYRRPLRRGRERVSQKPSLTPVFESRGGQYVAQHLPLGLIGRAGGVLVGRERELCIDGHAPALQI